MIFTFKCDVTSIFKRSLNFSLNGFISLTTISNTWGWFYDEGLEEEIKNKNPIFTSSTEYESEASLLLIWEPLEIAFLSGFLITQQQPALD